MAHVKKGITVPAPQWWKHLRPYCKRQFWHTQRKAFAADAIKEARLLAGDDYEPETNKD